MPAASFVCRFLAQSAFCWDSWMLAALLCCSSRDYYTGLTRQPGPPLPGALSSPLLVPVNLPRRRQTTSWPPVSLSLKFPVLHTLLHSSICFSFLLYLKIREPSSKKACFKFNNYMKYKWKKNHFINNMLVTKIGIMIFAIFEQP